MTGWPFGWRRWPRPLRSVRSSRPTSVPSDRRDPLGTPASARARHGATGPAARGGGASPLGGGPRPALGSDTDLVDPFERPRLADGRLVTRREALAQAVAERAVDLVVSALDVDALLDQVDINRVLDQIDLDRLLARI